MKNRHKTKCKGNIDNFFTIVQQMPQKHVAEWSHTIRNINTTFKNAKMKTFSCLLQHFLASLSNLIIDVHKKKNKRGKVLD